MSETIFLRSEIKSVGLSLGFPASWPDWESLVFVQTHYFTPLLLAAFLQLVAWLYLAACNSRPRQKNPFQMIKLSPFVILSTFLHFNFKAWIPLANPALYDHVYLEWDEALLPLLNFLNLARTKVANRINVDFAYHHLFVFAFFASFMVHSLADPPYRQRRLVMGICLILLVGGISYWIAPAVGPFIFYAGLNEAAQLTQASMLSQWNEFRATGNIPPSYFVSLLAAMPSLHVAHAFFLSAYAWKTSKWLFTTLVLCTVWFVIESVASNFHYLIDIFFGLMLSFGCAWATSQLIYRETQEKHFGH